MSKVIKYNRIAVYLVEIGVSQIDLASILKVSKSTIGRWCRNVSQPSFEQLHTIAEWGRIDVRSLLVPTVWDKTDELTPFELFLEEKKSREIKESKNKEEKKKPKK